MLERLSERVFVAPGGVNIGVIHGEQDTAILIDSGLNDSAVRKVLRAIDAEGRRVTTIITTHGHADHFGGNAYTVKRTRAQVLAPVLDEAILRYPIIQPLCLYAGADPPESMRGGFLLAAASPVDGVYDAGSLVVEGVAMMAVSLAGHSGNQMGILVDDIFFCADLILPDRVIERYRMPYLYSVRDHMDSFDRALKVTHRVAVPGHGPVLEHVVQGIEPNRVLVERIAGMVVDLCDEPRMPEEILALLLEQLGAEPQDAAAYYLLHPTVFAYLTYLEATGAVRHEVSRGRSLWSRA